MPGTPASQFVQIRAALLNANFAEMDGQMLKTLADDMRSCLRIIEELQLFGKKEFDRKVA